MPDLIVLLEQGGDIASSNQLDVAGKGFRRDTSLLDVVLNHVDVHAFFSKPGDVLGRSCWMADHRVAYL